MEEEGNGLERCIIVTRILHGDTQDVTRPPLLVHYMKFSYRRDGVHLTSLCRTVQKAFRYVGLFKGVRISYRQC